MKQINNLGKRCLALTMAILMLLSCGQNGLIGLISAVDDASTTVSTGQLLVKNYTLSSDQQTLLLSGLLNEQSYTYYVPTDSDDLVQVDADNRIITAQPYSRGGHRWIPVSAEVVSGENREVVALQEENDAYTGTFLTTGNTYSVEVNYVLSIYVAKEQQEKLLYAGADMKHALNQIDSITKQRANLELFTQYLDSLMRMVRGISLPWGGTVKYADESGAVRAFYNQKTANNGDIDLVKMMKSYQLSESKSQYLLTHGAEFYDTAVETMTYLQGICKDRTFIQTLINFAGGAIEDFDLDPKLISAAFDSLEEARDAIAAATEPKWEILDANSFRSDLSVNEYQALDSLMSNMDAQRPVVEIIENLKANSTVINVNMNRFNITVHYVAQVMDLNHTDTMQTVTLENRRTGRLSLDAGSTYQQVLNAIADLNEETLALADWSAYQVSKNCYKRTVSGMGQQDTLQSDITLTVTYTPQMMYTAGVQELSGEYPYGYNLTLPAHPEEGKVYDYYIDGVFYRQGQVFRVVYDAWITRTEGTPWVDTTWGNEISVSVEPQAGAILKNPGIKTGALTLRKPGNDAVTVSIEGEIYTVTASRPNSGISGLEWVPVQAWVVNNMEQVPVENFQNGIGTFRSAKFDKVQVKYELRLNNAVTEDTLLQWVNLPYYLTEQSLSQKQMMDSLLEKKDFLEKFGGYASLLKNLLRDERVNEKAATALTTIIENCINQSAQEQNLFLYEYLLQYEEKGLLWYYTAGNFEKLNEQFTLLREQLGIFIDETPQLLEIMKDYMDGIKPGMAEEYYSKIDGIRTTLDSINLLQPHEAIDRTAGELDLAALVAALEEAVGQVRLYETAPEVVIEQLREAPAPDKCSITLQVEVEGRGPVSISIQFSLNHILTEEDIANLQEQLETLIGQQTIPQEYYLHNTVSLPEAGTELTGGLTLTSRWTLKKIPVYVEGEEASLGVFTMTQPYVVLPACTRDGFRYRYHINGKMFETYDTSLSVTLTYDDMEFIRLGGKIRREEINIARQDVLDLIATLNNDLAKMGAISGAAFIPVEDAEGRISIVLRISPKTSGFNSKNILASVSKSLLMYNKYPYVDLGGHPLREDTQIHLQGILNAFLECGFDLNMLKNSINEDGTLRNMELEGHHVMEDQLTMSNGNTIPNATAYGAQLVQTTLSLAANATMEPTEVKIFLTIGDDGSNAEQFQKMKLGLEQITQFVNLQFSDGYAKLELTLTEQTYQKFLSAMIVTDHASLENVNALDYGVCVEYLYELIAPLLKDDTITTETLENTSNANVELSAAQDILKRLQDILRMLDENAEYADGHAVGNLYMTEASMDANSMLDKLPIPENLRGMVAENGGKFTIGVGVRLTNVDSHYQALVIDKTQPQAVVYTTNLQDALANAGEGAVVILLDHVSAEVTANEKIILDLNGKTLTGSVSGNLILVDSTLENSGQIAGTVAESVQDLRISDLYRVESENGSVKVYLNPALFAGEISAQQVAAALLTDIFFCYYTSAAVELNGEVIYRMDAADILAILEKGGRGESIFPDTVVSAGLNSVLKLLLKDLTDYASIAKALQAQKPLFTYELGLRAWNYTLSHEKETDTIVGGFAPIQEQKKLSLQLYVDGGTDLIPWMNTLAEAIEKNVQVELNGVQAEFGSVTLSGSGEISVKFRGGRNSEYAPALLAILSGQVADKAQIVAALEAWFADESVAPVKLVLENTSTELLFRAIRSINRDTDLTALVQTLGLQPENTEKLTALLTQHKAMLVYLSGQLNRLQIQGTQQKLGALEMQDTYGVYDLSDLFAGETSVMLLGGELPMTMEVTLELFNNDPSFEGGSVNVVTDGTVILGSKVDTENKIIYLDTNNAGITLEQFNMQVLHSATNADKVMADFVESSAEQKGVILRNGKYYVVNGAKVTFRASNDKSNTVAEEVYTVVILGDVNSDGCVNISDAVTLSNHIVGNLDLTQVMGNEAMLAANMDGTEVINISDVVRIAYKCVNNYTSILK